MNLKTTENRAPVQNFFDAAIACYVTSPKGIDFNRMRLADGVLFEVSDTAQEAQAAAVDRLIKALGAIRGHAADIEPLLWQAVADALKAGLTSLHQGDVDTLLDTISENAGKEVDLIKPCHSVVLLENTNNIVVGPVKIRRSSKALSEIRRLCPKSKIEVGEGPDIETDVMDVQIPHFVWQVKLAAASKVREEQAAWMVDIALSLVRLGVKPTNLGMNPPALGKVEAPPFSKSKADHNRMTIGESGRYSIGGWTMPCVYQLGIPAQRELSKRDFVKKAGLVFSSSKSSLAERFSQGLGWIARGRQSSDRPTRLLYFFTAIEALLSDSDKTAPIVQTVARHGSVLLSDKNEYRIEIAKTIRQLYGLRSSLVHTGKRGVVDKDANTIQYIADLLFCKVWNDVDLSMKHSRFVEVLSKASYGLPAKF